MKLSECRPTVGRGCWLGAPGRRFSRCGQWSGSISPGRQKLGGNLELETNGRTHGRTELAEIRTNQQLPAKHKSSAWMDGEES